MTVTTHHEVCLMLLSIFIYMYLYADIYSVLLHQLLGSELLAGKVVEFLSGCLHGMLR